MRIKKVGVLALVGLLILSACGSAKPKEAKETKVQETKVQEPVKSEVKADDNSGVKTEEQSDMRSDAKEGNDYALELNKTISFKDFDITLKEFSLVKDSDGGDVLKVIYDFTNNSEKATAPYMRFALKGYQDGIETDDMIFVLEGVDLGIGQRNIKPGATIKNAEATVGITDISQPLDLELSEIFSFDKVVYTMQLDLSTLK